LRIFQKFLEYFNLWKIANPPAKSPGGRMPIHVDWADANTRQAVVYTFEGSWDWAAFNRAVQTAYGLILAGGPDRVDVIADIRASSPLPPGTIQQVKKAVESAPAHFGQVIIVGATIYVRLLADVLGRIYPQLARQIQFAADMPAALELVAAGRDS
jgi:hypothetical protein